MKQGVHFFRFLFLNRTHSDLISLLIIGAPMYGENIHVLLFLSHTKRPLNWKKGRRITIEKTRKLKRAQYVSEKKLKRR